MTNDDDSPEAPENTLDPEIIEMIASDLDERAKTLQAEAERTASNAEELRKMAEKLRD